MAERRVKTNACKKATKISNNPLKIANPTETIDTLYPAIAPPILAKIKIRLIKERITICPAVIFANNLNINTNGFVNTPKISIGTKMNFTPKGTGGLNMCDQ